MKRILSTLLFLFSFGFAQSSLIERYTVENGLSQNLILSMTQDRHGFLWFGTKDGLNRFDGYSFRIFRSLLQDSTSLPSNYITVLYVDKQGVLWIGTSGGGLSRFNEAIGTFTTFHHVQNDSTTLPSNYINGIIGGLNGTLIVSTVDAGISFFDTTTKFFYSLHHTMAPIIPMRNSRGYLLDSDSTLWIGTNLSGVFRYHIPTRRLTHYTSGNGSSGPADNRINNIYKDTKGIYWISHGKGVDAFDVQKELFLSHQIIVDGKPATGVEMRELSGDNYFMNVYEQCGMYNIRTKIFKPLNTGAGIPSTYFDRSGMLWISTGGLGVIKYNTSKERFHGAPRTFWSSLFKEELQQSIKHNIVSASSSINQYSFQRDHTGEGWITIPRSKIIRYSVSTGKLHEYLLNDSLNGLMLPYVDRTIVDEANTVWFVLQFSAAKYDRAIGKFVYYNLQEYLPDGKKLVNNTEYASITTVFRDKQGIYWLGTPGAGMIRFDERKRTVELFTADAKKRNSLTSGFILTIHSDPNDSTIVWVGTDGGGLNRFDTKTNSVTHHFSTFDILPNDVVYGILSDVHGKLWMSSNNGLYVFDPVYMKILARYDADDGLQSNEFNRYEYWKDKTGKLYFGGINGWNSFYPDEITQSMYRPPVVLTDLKIRNKSVVYPRPSAPLHTSLQQTTRIMLQPDQNMISIEFASLDFSAPKKNRYRYLLKGFNEQWIDCGTERTATFTNLDAGSYTFRVEGTNSDGVWSAQGASIEFVVLPPYYQTWWFRAGIALIVIGSITTGVRRRFAHLNRERQMQEDFSRQILERQEHDRERIAAELHDGLGQNLLVVKNRALLGSQSVIENKNAKEHFENISTIISDTLKEVRSISHNLRPYQLDSLGLSETIRSTIKKLSESTLLEISFKVDEIDHCFPKEQEINIFRVVQECFNNIIKHADATKAEITVERRSKDIYITIIDNGKGMSEHTSSDKGFGIMGMRERVKMLHGTMHVVSQPKKGTTLFIELPL